MGATLADISISSSSSNSISISTEESETNKAYNLEINIEGIAPSSVSLKVDRQTLHLEASQGNIGKNSMAGGQLLSFSFSFPEDANMSKISRLNSKNKITITILKY